MADISSEDLKNAVRAVLKTADLSVISTKGVRELVERKLNISLMNRKKEFDSIVMEYINSQQDDSDTEEEDEECEDDNDVEEEEEAEEEDEEDDDGEEEEDDNDSGSSKKSNSSSGNGRKHNSKKRNQKNVASRKTLPKKKRKSLNASDSGTESGGGSDSDYEVPKKKATISKKKKKSSTGSSGGASKDSVGGRKSTGFTRSYKLSSELSALMGCDSLPRHEVVKKVWAIIKERNLYDPKNKQFAICDDELMKVMKVKRFRTFGMLKHLKPHFLN